MWSIDCLIESIYFLHDFHLTLSWFFFSYTNFSLMLTAFINMCGLIRFRENWFSASGVSWPCGAFSPSTFSSYRRTCSCHSTSRLISTPSSQSSRMTGFRCAGCPAPSPVSTRRSALTRKRGTAPSPAPWTASSSSWTRSCRSIPISDSGWKLWDYSRCVWRWDGGRKEGHSIFTWRESDCRGAINSNEMLSSIGSIKHVTHALRRLLLCVCLVGPDSQGRTILICTHKIFCYDLKAPLFLWSLWSKVIVIGWLIDILIDRLIDRLIDWLMDGWIISNRLIRSHFMPVFFLLSNHSSSFIQSWMYVFLGSHANCQQRGKSLYRHPSPSLKQKS